MGVGRSRAAEAVAMLSEWRTVVAVGAGVMFPAALAWWLLIELRRWMEQVTAALYQLSSAVQQLAASQQLWMTMLEIVRKGGG